MIMGKKIALILVFLLVLPHSAEAQKAVSVAEPAQTTLAVDTPAANKNSSGLPIPRFVSLAKEKVFVRTGPALRYPVKWIYQREKLPVEIIQEFDTWRKIRDMDGDSGWVHTSMLSGDRSVIVKGEVPLSVRKEALEGSNPVVLLEPNVVAEVGGCHGTWCEVSSQGYTGWAQRKFLWGIYDSEDFD